MRAVAPLRFFLRGAYVIPHREKRRTGGEDAFFMTADGRSLGVADGVGGWAEQGVNPALYAQQLMRSAWHFASTMGGQFNAFAVIDDAYKATTEKRVLGSCTAATAVVVGDRKLSLYHIGDCGIVVVRDGKIVYRTDEQQHYFNCPYQLGTGSGSTPASGITKEIEAQEYDVVVLGSDGLFDNLHDNTLLDLVLAAQPKGPHSAVDCTLLAKTIAEAATRQSSDRRFLSPFAERAAQQGIQFMGGKEDDVTAVVGQVLEPATASSLQPPFLASAMRLIDDFFPFLKSGQSKL